MSNAIEARGGREIEPQRLLPVRAEPEMQATEDRLDLRSLLVTLRRRLGLILGVLATVLVLGIAITALGIQGIAAAGAAMAFVACLVAVWMNLGGRSTGRA